MQTGKIFYNPISHARYNFKQGFNSRTVLNYFNLLQKFSIPKFGKIKIDSLLFLLKHKIQTHCPGNILAKCEEYNLLKHLLKNRIYINTQWLKGKTKRSKIVFGTIALSVFDWNSHRIKDADVLKHVSEFDYICDLKRKTLVCNICHKRRKIDNAIPGVSYCKCTKVDVSEYTYDDWSPFLERQDVMVWRKPADDQHYEYKVYGCYNDVTAEDFLYGQIDCNYRKLWDTTAKKLEIIESEPETNSDIVYWETVWPRFFTNRDYVFNRRYLVSKETKTIVIVNQVTEHKSCPIKPEKYRVQEYWSFMVIKPRCDVDKPGIEFILTYYDNPGVNIPNAVTSWVAGSAMPDFLSRLRQAAKGYKMYLQRTGNIRKELMLSVMKNVERNVEVSDKGTETESWKYFYPYYYLG